MPARAHPQKQSRTLPTPTAPGRPLPLGPVLLELRNGRRWAFSLSALVQILGVSLLLIFPLLARHQPPPPQRPILIVKPLRGETRGEDKTEPGGGQPGKRKLPSKNLTALLPLEPPPPGQSEPRFEEAGVGNGMGAPRYGDPYGSDEGLPLFTGETPAPPSAPPAPVRVGGKVRPPRLVHIVEPDYPNFLRQARIEGSVVLEAVINASGRIVQLTVVRSDHPLLTGAARRAVEQWIYEPTYLNDQPVPVLLTITVEFRLKK